MCKFSSYGPVNKTLHYYVPRQELVDRACTQLLGENPDEGGHYITVWAPRQRGKTWVMRKVLWRLQKAVDDANRARYEALYEDEETGVRVRPVLVATGT
jgi:hypothetical protein